MTTSLRLSLLLAVGAFMAIAPAASQPPLQVIQRGVTPNGFRSSVKGWNSFGINANPHTTPSFSFSQTGVTSQCDVLATNTALRDAGYIYCSLDSGWSDGSNGDEYGRITYNSSIFDIPSLADHLHDEGLELGVYVVPGAFIADEAKTVLGTNVTIGSVCSGDSGLSRCNFDYSQRATQEWHDSVVNQFASWGVDLIKLDYVTPGSIDNSASLPSDSSGAVIAYHRAIAQSGRSMRLDISWKLDRSQEYFDIWESNADSMRTDQDINNSQQSTFVSWGTIQRAIENYRQYITTVMQYNTTTTIFPDMDNLFVGNPAAISGITDSERQTVMTHWLGAGSNLMIGSDLTNLDDFGLNLLTSSATVAIGEGTDRLPMQPRNPGTGNNSSQQLQAWIAGPDTSGAAIVVISNYGPDQGEGGFGTSLSGAQTVNVSWADLGISGTYSVHDAWANKDLGSHNSSFSLQLDEGQSVMYQLRR